MRVNAQFAAAIAAGVFSLSLGAMSPANGTTDTAKDAESHIVAEATDKKPKQSTNEAPTDAAPEPKTVTVKPGDSLAKIAATEHTTWVRLYDANDSIDDPNLIYPGQDLTIPTADQKLPDRYGKLTAEQVATMPVVTEQTTAVAPQPAYTAATYSGYGHSGGSAGNPYVWGTCTWYVKNQRPDVGSYWGNAGYAWLGEARAAGFATGSTPRPGAVAVTGGHAAIVEAVHGGQVDISEMNYAGGVGVIHHRTVPAGSFQYIY